MVQIGIKYAEPVSASIVLPASKSISNRAMIIKALAGSAVNLSNISTCDDSMVVVKALDQLSKHASGNTINIMAAGTAMRFMTAMLCVSRISAGISTVENVITGTERMLHRPIGILVDALRQIGAEITYLGEDGYPPLKIKGQELEGGEVTLPGNVSSQYISALLMIGPKLRHGLKLSLEGRVVSRPYIDMTLAIMRQFGAEVKMESPNVITVKAKPYSPIPYRIENDWSAASYWYEVEALATDKMEITIPGLFKNSLQGDSRVAEFFRPLGVETDYIVNADGIETVVLHKTQCGDIPSKYELSLIDQPDLAQTLVATCCALDKKFRFTGLDNLRIKETDRLSAMQTELRKLGYVVQIVGTGTLEWNGEKCEPTAEPIETYDDHRMAMALAPMAMRCGTLVINNPNVVSKSYPAFWENLKTVGFEEQC